MPTNDLYHNWMRQICELRPKQRITQVRNFVWLLIGIYQSRSVHLSRIAGKIPGPAKLVSVTRRLSRFLDNPAVNVREWYQPIAQQWLQAQWHCLGEIRLIVDGTRVGFGHTLLMVSRHIGEEEAWYLATNLLDRTTTLKYYQRRMWCKELHGDLKKHGFDLESTMLHDFDRLSRLTLAVAFLYVWSIAMSGGT